MSALYVGIVESCSDIISLGFSRMASKPWFTSRAHLSICVARWQSLSWQCQVQFETVCPHLTTFVPTSCLCDCPGLGDVTCTFSWLLDTSPSHHCMICYVIHSSKYLGEQIFKAIHLEIYWEQSFQIVALFSWIILLDNAVVAGKKLANFFFTNPRGE